MKPIDLKSNTYIDSSKIINNKKPKFIKISKYQNIKIQKYFYRSLLTKSIRRSF